MERCREGCGGLGAWGQWQHWNLGTGGDIGPLGLVETLKPFGTSEIIGTSGAGGNIGAVGTGDNIGTVVRRRRWRRAPCRCCGTAGVREITWTDGLSARPLAVGYVFLRFGCRAREVCSSVATSMSVFGRWHELLAGELASRHGSLVKL